MDYEKITKYSTLLIQEQEYVRKCLNAKFPWILIDEYQDLGRPCMRWYYLYLLKLILKYMR